MRHFIHFISFSGEYGVGCAYLSIAITNWFFRLFEKNKENAFYNFVLNFELAWFKPKKK